MYQIQVGDVTDWGCFEHIFVPLSVTVECPHCSRKGTFHQRNPLIIPPGLAIVTQGTCPVCEKLVAVFAFEPADFDLTTQRTCKAVAIYPPPSTVRTELEAGDEVTQAFYSQLQSGHA